jgi:DNA-binding FadR family transcriptional regulator
MPRPPKSLAVIVGAPEEDILFGRLRTRERLIEDERIERFGATRHVVRQALVEARGNPFLARRAGDPGNSSRSSTRAGASGRAARLPSTNTAQ